ncbi:MAG: FAD-dependent oxidoreductase [Deltaproteobacteria bacterium]|nr:FAD-dependent oxidoreductase [Deltaproteobacteria bacterium]
MKPLSKLFSPIKIGSMELKNRIVMAPMATDYANQDGTLSRKSIDYYEARAKGGAALITVEPTSIDEKSPYVPNTIAMWDDKFIPQFKEFTDALHAHGAKVAPQIMHPGPESLAPFFHNMQPVGPSPAMCHATKQVCREITHAEIEKILEQFGEAAGRAKEAGCDGMELHAAHSYMLVGSFLSPLRNKRVDEYGGSIDGRLKFPLEVIKSIRSGAGNDFAIIMRLSGDMMVPGGMDIRDVQYIAPILVEAGIDAFHISRGVFPEASWCIIPPTGSPLRPNAGLSAAVKEVVDVPVMVVGRINDPRIAEEVLTRNEADLVVMGRALLADPDLPNKAAEGRFEDIAPCIACGLGCIVVRSAGNDMTCIINPEVGREGEMAIVPTDRPKKVMVIGAGPAGLEAARVSALRGHDVTLYEKESKPGGQFNLAAVPPFKQELSKIIRYLHIQTEKAGVNIRLNTEVTAEQVEKMKPDVVIVATGGGPLVPDIPGINGDRVVTAHDVLAGKVVIPSGNVAVIGGGMVGIEVADFLGTSGDNMVVGRTAVTVIEMMDDISTAITTEARELLMQSFREKQVKIRTLTTVKEFLEDGVLVEKDGQEESIRGIDYIVLGMGVRPIDDISDKIKDKVSEVYVIGDAKEGRTVLEAIAEGSEVGRKI